MSQQAGPPGDSIGARAALGSLLTGATAIAFAPILVRLSAVGPIATAFWRMALAGVPLWGWMLLRAARNPAAPRPTRRDCLALMVPGVFFAGDLAVWHWSLRLTSVANATLLANLAPVLVTLGAWWWLKERIRPAFLAGLVLALAGTTMLLWTSLGFSRENLIGDGLGLVTAAFYAGYQLSVKRLRASFPTVWILAFSAVSCCVLLGPMALASRETFVPPALAGWGVVAALAWGCHLGGQGLIAYALARLPASFSSVSLLWWILREPLLPWQAAGGVFVLVGIGLARRGSASAQDRPAGS